MTRKDWGAIGQIIVGLILGLLFAWWFTIICNAQECNQEWIWIFMAAG